MATRESAPLGQALDQLLSLQKIDSERDRVGRARAHLDSGAAHQVRARDAQFEADRLKTQLSEDQGLLKDAELEQSGVEAKIKSYEERQRFGQVTNAREVSNIQREIGQLIRQRGVLDDKILTLMDRIESGRTEFERAEGHAREAEQESVTQVAAYRASLAAMDAELNRLNAERVGVAACVTDAPLLQRYESLRARPACAGVAVARIVEKHCSGCGNQVSSNDADKVREAAVVITCETCSRILAIVE